ncbi:MAG: bifunctional diaminohydroxyphosphoribosylaminopyrimidine deaminase/5-amino-6-(5-phosphoribosylamino)uracil reductase RibD [Calditrichaeota bacterium]|nr:bifunctional diaminohydroxyphosphoribosylaminopyrimidine deaminase/5-amino-6-(5-phosphoribosylamino)uracil reductase RibD [Calditrichota bacterium]MCB9368445.1 bifunctional diaminohydroxyphosphoribosylaminopyrimidine deaminase/5-amino-6-(5-phosphoribosylamino)uracil reductase RibD [Calditrichota bacterium]
MSDRPVSEKRVKLSEDERFMRMALREAEKGAGFVSPNPLVGAIAVKNGKVLAKAYHRKFGDLHAETALLKKLTEDEARGATVYVNLEPCCHVGKTAPCTTALMNAGVKKVVIAHQDPNPLVNGNGMTILSDSGIEVRVGVCEAEARRLNAPFLTFMTKGRPWILLKIAQSLDGRIALANGESRWITGQASRTEVHRLRTKLDALLVGVQTVLDDDPLLNVRHVKGRDPVRVIADSRLRIPESSHILSHKDQSKTWILTTDGVDEQKVARLKQLGVVVIFCRQAPDGRVDMKHAMREIARRDVTSVLVEGGGTVHASLLTDGLWDELIVAVAPMLIGADGRPSVGELGLETLQKAPRLTTHRQEMFDEDHWYYLERDVHGHC